MSQAQRRGDGLALQVVRGMVRQMLERIDRVRLTALKALRQLLLDCPQLPGMQN